jgi:predicted negative regulator of RcsB-dependent stress response
VQKYYVYVREATPWHFKEAMKALFLFFVIADSMVVGYVIKERKHKEELSKANDKIQNCQKLITRNK